MKKSLLFLSFLLFFTGCAPKVTISSLQSSKVNNPSSRQLSVLEFKQDKIGQRASIIAELSKLKIENKPYFTLVEREHLEEILKEKRLNDSALVDIKDFSSIKGLTQVKAFLTGEVIHSRMQRRHYNKIVNNYNRCAQYNKDKECIRYSKIFMHCQTNTYSVLTQIKLTEVESAHVIFSERYLEEDTQSACGSERTLLDSKSTRNAVLAQRIAKKVLKDIAPSYRTFSVILLEEMDQEMTTSQENRFENALKMLQNNHYSEAQELLMQLHREIPNSYVVLYNLALSYEALNNLDEALKFYVQAEKLAIEKELPEEISEAILRIKHNQNERNKVKNLIK
ncbi:tetratricopeptide repeat protein [Candidatus Marinarcus aquaticus]|uniref:Uncharacterized protein n=1 Tax=Candidatus Marinarcus aquaticus TaxID=2044504 RepID=A0A4Q0XV02_9BACT|nr:tetratricopeptide repeat protein [Candidatus Marinarcus aquaticus]RXJ59969.1 hypothetical protein CRV04_02835 [Candidatus Marinarcus aquaticus]